ncbi:MAG TPA: metallopeptidase family protein [Candidatus Sulfotelmatobacter sp.]|nr:metallopeptidase family protein [Candidatus Sulfotelmatobacter sp.]
MSPFETLTESEWERVEQVWRLIEKGELDSARRDLTGLQHERGRHPDLGIVDAALHLEAGEPQDALEALHGAERSADPAQFFHLRALAHFELVQLESARDDAERAITVNPALAEAHELLSRVYEHLGDETQSAVHATTAQDLDAESFPGALEVSDEDFDELVEQALGELPERVRNELHEVRVLVQPLPERHVLTGGTPPLPPDILGLFVGRHLMERSHSDLPDEPPAIYLFRRNLLRSCADRDELAREIRITLQHEVGHLLGLDEDELEEWGLA